MSGVMAQKVVGRYAPSEYSVWVAEEPGKVKKASMVVLVQAAVDRPQTGR